MKTTISILERLLEIFVTVTYLLFITTSNVTGAQLAPTISPSPTGGATPTSQPATPVVSATPEPTPTPVPTPSSTPTATNTPIPSLTPSPMPIGGLIDVTPAPSSSPSAALALTASPTPNTTPLKKTEEIQGVNTHKSETIVANNPPISFIRKNNPVLKTIDYLGAPFLANQIGNFYKDEKISPITKTLAAFSTLSVIIGILLMKKQLSVNISDFTGYVRNLFAPRKALS